MYTVPMALADFIPVFLFGWAALVLHRELYGGMGRGAYTLFAAGTVDVFLAGALKALYKLLYAAGVCDFEVLSRMFFPVQALGFLMTGAGLIWMLRKPGDRTLYAAVPALYSGTFIFVALMVAGLGATDAVLARVAWRRGKKNAAVLFIVSFLFCLCMGYLASKDFTQAYMNWAAELVNMIGQGSLLAGALLLRGKKKE